MIFRERLYLRWQMPQGHAYNPAWMEAAWEEAVRFSDVQGWPNGHVLNVCLEGA